jgi:hypothetical protein
MRRNWRPGETLKERRPPTSLRIGLGLVRRGDVLPGFAAYLPDTRAYASSAYLGRIGTKRPRFENLDALKC